jgi:hypothetical protein
LTLGTGKKLFDDGTIPAAFTLTESLATPTTNELEKSKEVLLEIKLAKLLINLPIKI